MSKTDSKPDPSLTANVQHPAILADPKASDNEPKLPNEEGHGQALGSKDALKKVQPVLDRLQEIFDEETDKGYRGHNPDPVPNEAYTLPGVLKGDPSVSPEPTVPAAEPARKA